jgi:uncharacterized protein
MRVLVDVSHPANFHILKHLILRLQGEGHEVQVTARDKDVTLPLLDALNIPYACLCPRGRGLVGMAAELVRRNLRMLGVARRFRPDVLVASDAGVSIGPVGMALGVPRVVFDQADRAHLQRAVGLPFATVICTGEGYLSDHGARHVRFRGFLTQAYLDPRRFQPDPEVVRRAGINPDEPYTVLRLVAWESAHDVGRKGLGGDRLQQTINRLSRHGRVVLSSEAPLPEAFRSYANPVPVEHWHHMLAFAGLCLAEGGTVSVEASLLGTPAICLDTYDFGYLRVLDQKYGLIERAASPEAAIEAADRLLAMPNRRQLWQEKCRRLTAETDDVAEVMYRVVERTALQNQQRRSPHAHPM